MKRDINALITEHLSNEYGLLRKCTLSPNLELPSLRLDNVFNHGIMNLCKTTHNSNSSGQGSRSQPDGCSLVS